MASIQQSIGGLTGSIFAATAMGSHLIQSSPEYRAGKIEKEAEKLRQAGMGTRNEDAVYERYRDMIQEAARISPTAERVSEAYDIDLERAEEADWKSRDQKKYQEMKAARQAEQEKQRASDQFVRMVMAMGQRDLSRQQTESYQQEFQRWKEANANK